MVNKKEKEIRDDGNCDECELYDNILGVSSSDMEYCVNCHSENKKCIKCGRNKVCIITPREIDEKGLTIKEQVSKYVCPKCDRPKSIDKYLKMFESENIKVEGNKITFEIQDGPINQNGCNGNQIDMLGEVWLGLIRELSKEFPCRENSIAMTKIEEAQLWQLKRTMDRTKRGVEGYDKK